MYEALIELWENQRSEVLNLAGTYNNGYDAAMEGKPREAPYDKESAFHRVWLDGYDDGK